jgi:hypothetical protein
MLNAVFDGEATYLKDSGTEKTLTAGETASIRRLYESIPTDIQTNGLFLEGLNREPKSSDKSSALQKRLVRFYLPNTYPEDRAFWDKMTSPHMLGAFLAVLIDHYVSKSDSVAKLAPTSSSRELMLEYKRVNDVSMQFLEWVESNDILGANGLIDEDLMHVAEQFKSWRLTEFGELNDWSIPDIESRLRPLFVTERKSRRVGSKVLKTRVVSALRPEALEFLNHIREEAPHDEDAMVGE